jgi:integrase/recombinase XerD
MTPLRQRMLEDMQLRGLAARTQESYLAAVRQLAVHYDQSPDQLTEQELRQYFLYLRNDKRVAPNTANVALHAVKFLYVHTLQRPWPLGDLIRPALPQKLPVVLSVEEVWRVLNQIRLPHYHVCLSVIAACGLRLLEGVQLQVAQIDSARMQLHIRGGKGNKDRIVPLPSRTLTQLRTHWCTHRNPIWLFPHLAAISDQRRTATAPMDARGLQKAFHRAVQEVGLNKPASVHSLRHSWATHLLESGVNLRLIQLWMGHTSPTTTAIYTHLTRTAEGPARAALDQLTAGMP